MFDKTIPTDSPINIEGLEGQNRKLYEHLQAGNTINFLQASDLGIRYLNSRISDLNKQGLQIHSRFIRIGYTKCKEYSINPFTDK